MRRKPEILAPAGDMEKLQMAVLYGADAVYLAGTSFGMRSFAGNFTPEELPKAVKFAHDHGVRVHVTVNTMPRNDEVARLPEHLERLNDAGVDALILADLGAFTLAGKYAPKCRGAISRPSSRSQTTSAPARGTIWARNEWCWQGKCLYRRSAKCARKFQRSWRSRPSVMARCA